MAYGCFLYVHVICTFGPQQTASKGDSETAIFGWPRDTPVAADGHLRLILSSCVSLQAEYEVTPDEKRKECGQELVDKYFNPKVAAACVDFLVCFPVGKTTFN